MMLYDFQILFIMILGFFISNEEWDKILIRFKLLLNNIKAKYTR